MSSEPTLTKEQRDRITRVQEVMLGIPDYVTSGAIDDLRLIRDMATHIAELSSDLQAVRRERDEANERLRIVQEQDRRNYELQLADARESFRLDAAERIAAVRQQLEEANEKLDAAEQHIRILSKSVASMGPRIAAAEARADAAYKRGCDDMTQKLDGVFVEQTKRAEAAERKFKALVDDFNEVCLVNSRRGQDLASCRDVLQKLYDHSKIARYADSYAPELAAARELLASTEVAAVPAKLPTIVRCDECGESDRIELIEKKAFYWCKRCGTTATEHAAPSEAAAEGTQQ